MLELNQDFIKEHAKYFRNALVLASIGEYSEYEHITNFLKDAVSYKIVDSGKYKTIKNYELDRYQYNYHNYKKIDKCLISAQEKDICQKQDCCV